MSPVSTRKRLAVAGAAASLLLLAWWAGQSSTPLSDPAPVPGARSAALRPRVRFGAPAAPAVTSAVAAAKTSSDAHAAPIIDEVVIEKSQVCAGEENLISVMAHTPNGADADLHYAIAGQTGQHIPLRLWPDDEGQISWPRISVFGRHNVVTSIDLPAYSVKPCKTARAAVLLARLMPNTTSEFELEAKIVDFEATRAPRAKAFQAVRYLWRFGDGQSQSTALPRVLHDFGDRAQSSLYAQLLLEVDIQSRDGEHLVGRHMLQLMNPAYQNFAQKGVVVLMLALDPRFPELRSDGVVAQGVRLFHARAEPVTIAKITRSLHSFGDGAESVAEPVEVGSLIPGGTIPSGHGVEFQVALDTRARPDVFSIDYRLEGETVQGFPVRGGFSVMRPPEPPTRENHRPVDDPVLIAKIQAARQILGKEWVSDQDIWQLEREGRLASLPPAAASEAPAQASDQPFAGEPSPADPDRTDSRDPTEPADSELPVGPSQPPSSGAVAGANGGAVAPSRPGTKPIRNRGSARTDDSPR